MKSTLFITIAIASIASVFAAVVPGARDMSATAGSNVGKQVTAASETAPIRANVQDTVKQDTTSVVNQSTNPVIKQDTDIFDDLGLDEGYTPFAISSPTKDTTYTKGDIVTIQWSNGIEGPFLIHLLTGEKALSMLPTKVKLRGEGTKGYYEWVVPKDLTDGVYAFKFTFKNNGKQQETYSDQFKIASVKSP